MKPFDDFFSFAEIAKTLSAWRIAIAAKRHRQHLYWSRLQLDDPQERPENSVPSPLDALLPPRRQWRRGDKVLRKRLLQGQVAENALFRTIMGSYQGNTLGTTAWGRALAAFGEGLRKRVRDGNFTLSAPRLLLIRKNGGRAKTSDETEEQNSYRCLATFDTLEDRLLLNKTAVYLRDLFDVQLRDCCYAFRKDSRTFSFHSAVKALIDYRKRFAGKTLYVADCDIQKFFDSISHEVVLNAYDTFARRCGRLSPDPRARKVLKAYLDVYTFPRNLETSLDPKIVKNRDSVSRVPEEALAHLHPGSIPALGIPQGGALSPLLANLVMDAADEAVLSSGDKDLFYARFCDDIIIVHPDETKCQEALQRYLSAMTSLKLPVHELSQDKNYSAKYFTEKSKGPVAWQATHLGQPGTPWVSFLGHQIRYDSAVRIRKETLQKHQQSLWTEFDILRRNLKKAKNHCRSATSGQALRNALLLRIISMGVGKSNKTGKALVSRSWLAVFRDAIWREAPAIPQLKALDRMRTRVLKAVKRVCAPILPKDEIHPSDGETAKRKPPRPYFGAPFSYYGTLQDLPRPSLDKSARDCHDLDDYRNL